MNLINLKRIRIELDAELTTAELEQLRTELEQRFKAQVYFIYTEQEARDVA